MDMNKLSVIVIGALNTDIFALGAQRLLTAGENARVEQIHIGAGGKARNMAQMIAVLAGKQSVAMIGRTSTDPYGLWKVPVDSLKGSGVNTDYIYAQKDGKMPGIALIPVDKKGQNQIYVSNGVNDDLSTQDIDKASDLFSMVAKNKGYLVLSLESPYETVLYAIKKANGLGIKVLLDPGGLDQGKNYDQILEQKIFLLKPNEHEARFLTGIEVRDEGSAQESASKLLAGGIENVLITIGSQGGYLFEGQLRKHIPIPQVSVSNAQDETGCGDQAMAALVYGLLQKRNMEEAAKTAILAGTIQFYKPGIVPVETKEIARYSKNPLR